MDTKKGILFIYCYRLVFQIIIKGKIGITKYGHKRGYPFIY